MFFIVVGVLLILLKFAGIEPVASWNLELFGHLWRFVLPFVLALAWWGWADASGLTRRREIEKDSDRKAERRRRSVEALGLGPKDGKGAQRRR